MKPLQPLQPLQEWQKLQNTTVVIKRLHLFFKHANVQVYTQKSMFLAFFGQGRGVDLGTQRVIFSKNEMDLLVLVAEY